MSGRQLLILVLAFVLVSVTGGLIVAGMAVPLTGVARAATESAAELTDVPTDEFLPDRVSQSSFVYAADGSVLATVSAKNRVVVPLEDISEPMREAVVAIEDERFYEHGGVDPQAIVRAGINNLSGEDTQGASTLTQQYVKNALIDQAAWSDDPFAAIEAREGTMERKLREAAIAVSVEQEMTKDEILEGYLNVAPFGPRVYGVEAAAQHYFSKSAAELDVVEAATIAGITRSPSALDPTRHPQAAQDRRDVVLAKMLELGDISRSEHDDAVAAPVPETLDITPVELGCQSAEDAAFFCGYVVDEILSNPAFGASEDERGDLLYRGGLSITTTLDPTMQEAAEQQLADKLPSDDGSGLDAAVVSVEPGTGRILAMAQNVPYGVEEGATSINYAAGPARGASRGMQPGSTFKPFVLAEWLMEGHTLDEYVDADNIARYSSDFDSSCTSVDIGSEAWSPANTEGAAGGSVTVREATEQSANTAFVDMATQLDLCGIRDTAWDMGFRPTLSSDGTALAEPTKEDVQVTPSMVLGTQNTSPLQMSAAYATLASNGTYCDPVAIDQVSMADGTHIDLPSNNCDPSALPADVSATVVDAMQGVLTEGSASGNGLDGGRPAAGKTGTSQLSAQTWFVGFTAEVSTAVWVGEVSGDTPHLDVTVGGVRMQPLYGSSVAAPLWKDYMDAALGGTPVTDLP
ncbi:transglycosylase domain-containing protein [Promicromonospora iranensis]|uniref:Membrane peptidoglycan carboxypeptidase n=1 Tax=Promicromonospora iranensis TaxID=1105144 RepID=A0ABU2CWX3_9MICO|nr:transglycosylase domain-containing protein [Promicromonospora iranensis]MDR7385786.1 membrane peptidoglycan carboxypeptidase [Promicromonospora iranensis]